MSVFIVVILDSALRDCGEVNLGVVDAVEDVGEDGRCERETDIHQLRVGVSRDLDRCELVIADRAACFGERASEADQRVAMDIARGLAIAGSS
jgi:hypothetical protein